MRGGRRSGRGGAVDDGGIGGPPEHVAGTFIEIAVDQFDGIERQVDHPFAPRPLGHALHRAHEVAGALGQLTFEVPRDALDLLADAAHLLRDHREARALRARARTFDQCIQRQHLHLVGDLLDRSGFFARDLVDLGGQAGDQLGNIGFFADIVGIR
jgi:hypothetical protein